MTDPQRVVGGSSLWRNMARMPFLPLRELGPAMAQVMKGQHMVMGAQSASFYAGKAKEYQSAYLLTRNRQHSAARKGLTLCHDPAQLIAKYKNSDEELLVLGGLSTWRRFLPCAQHIRTVETLKNVPGDLVFKDWDDGSFMLAREQVGRKLVVREYVLKVPD